MLARYAVKSKPAVDAVILGDGMSVTIDDDFARFGAKSYAINKINSVEVRERQPHGKGGAVLLALVGGFILLGALGSLSDPKAPTQGMLVFAVVSLAIAYWLWQRSKIREYQLFLMTNSSETQAYVSYDADEIVALRSRIEGAMLHHSRGAIIRP